MPNLSLPSLGKFVTFEYNNLGQLVSKMDQLGHFTTLEYDFNGNLTQEIDPNGNLKSYEYNDSDQLVRKILPDNVSEFSYDIRGNLIQAKNNISQVEFTYEHFEDGDMVVQESTHGIGTKSDYPASNLFYDFDPNANRISMQTSVGDFFYTFDHGDRLTNVQNHKEASIASLCSRNAVAHQANPLRMAIEFRILDIRLKENRFGLDQ